MLKESVAPSDKCIGICLCIVLTDGEAAKMSLPDPLRLFRPSAARAQKLKTLKGPHFVLQVLQVSGLGMF
jgi:hypothetical protein